MTKGLRVNNIAPVGERPSDLIRGRTGVTVAGVGTILGSPITGVPANLDILYYDSATDAWLLADASSLIGGNFELRIEGGLSKIQAHGAMGATETFDPTDGNVHTGTLDAACTFTLNNPTGTGACTLELQLTQDGTGGWAVTWPGTVTVIGTLDTTAGTTSKVIVETVDGGTSWLAVVVGGGATGTVTSVALTVPAEFSVAGSPITTTGTLAVTKANESANTVWAGPVSGAAAQPTFRALVASDIPAGSGVDHEHVMDCLFSGDGATTVWTLPAVPFDQYSVAAYVAGVLTEVTLSGTLFDIATFGVAPASATNNIRFDIVAAVI